MSTADKAVERQVSARWTASLTAGGWTPISDYFLENYSRLEPPISTSEAMLVIHLMKYKWDVEPPFVGFAKLAKTMAITTTAVRNHARSLDTKGYLARQKRVGTTNKFDLTPLFRALEKLQAFDAGRESAQQESPPKVSLARRRAIERASQMN